MGKRTTMTAEVPKCAVATIEIACARWQVGNTCKANRNRKRKTQQANKQHSMALHVGRCATTSVALYLLRVAWPATTGWTASVTHALNKNGQMKGARFLNDLKKARERSIKAPSEDTLQALGREGYSRWVRPSYRPKWTNVAHPLPTRL